MRSLSSSIEYQILTHDILFESRGMENATNVIKEGSGRAPMQTIRERYGKTPVQKEISVVIKKAYCGFERLEREHDERIRLLLASIRTGSVGAQAA